MSETAFDRDEFLRETATTWNEFLTYIESLTDEQMTRPTDDAGWTAKDHVIHVAAWEKAALARLEGKSKRETLQIAPEIWEQGDDPINAVLQQRYQHLSRGEVMQTLNQTHERFMQKLQAMSAADMQLPYRHFQPQSSEERPIHNWLAYETYYHYREHLTWIAAIVG